MEQDGMLLEFASESMKNNLEVVSMACQQNGLALYFGSNYIKQVENVCLFALE